MNDFTTDIENQLEYIKKDLIARNMLISAIVAINPDESKQTVIGYRPNGVIYFVSDSYPIINLYGSEFGKGGMRTIGDIYSEMARKKYIEQETNKKQELQRIMEEKKSKEKKIRESSMLRYILSFKWTYDWTL